jgi:hypothetical protein
MKTREPDYADHHISERPIQANTGSDPESDTGPDTESNSESDNSFAEEDVNNVLSSSNKGRNDSISDLLFLYNITFLSDSKVSTMK